MNYLTLCQTVRQECGASGNGPASVVAQTGESLRFVSWVNRAWLKIQTSRNSWRWMHATSTLALTQDQSAYDKTALVPTRFGRWDNRNWAVYLTADGVTSATELLQISYDEFERTYILNAVESGRPVVYAIGPDDKVYLGPAPAAGYTLRFRYYKSAQTLVNNADIPELPEDYHWIIVYEAMKYYARREAAPEVMADAQIHYEAEEYRLERDQLETMVAYDETLA